jgi:hypothetical protein
MTPVQPPKAYRVVSSLSASLEISAGSSISNRPIAMIFSATSCVMGSLRSFKRSARKVCRHQTFNVLRLERRVLYQLVNSHRFGQRAAASFRRSLKLRDA